jgi:hypothetical protein
MDDWNKNDELWDLLGRARPAGVSPFFARRVLAHLPDRRDQPLLRLLVLRWAGALSLAVLAAGFVLTFRSDEQPMTVSSRAFIEVFDSAAGLDKIATVEDFSVSSYANGL